MRSKLVWVFSGILLISFSSVVNAQKITSPQSMALVKLLIATTPDVAYKTPNGRHYAKSVKQGSTTKEKNTVIMPGVDVAADVTAINSGSVKKVDDKFTVNGRTYGHHDGILFPIEGKGFYLLGRGAFNALGVYNDFKNTAKADQILTSMKIDPDEKKLALKIWNELQS
jgi:hypothetical protein